MVLVQETLAVENHTCSLGFKHETKHNHLHDISMQNKKTLPREGGCQIKPHHKSEHCLGTPVSGRTSRALNKEAEVPWILCRDASINLACQSGSLGKEKKKE